MNVELYVYDLSKGLARQFSYSFTGVHLDAIYHTSLVFGGVEYFFGQGILRKVPGSTHHGKPIEVVQMGKTELPMDVIAEYIDSLAQIYTPESYDLFLHNCNNFTQDLSMFLVGKNIPERIRTLPQRFLETPVGQMLRSQIDQSMRSMTQAPDAKMPLTNRQQPVYRASAPTSNGLTKSSALPRSDDTHGASIPAAGVHNVTTLQEIQSLLDSARNSCAVIFFTSATCAPCKILYPSYDELAAEAGKRAVLIKVDLNQALSISSKYNVRATPTFMTYLKGQKENQWSGANEAQLKGNSLRLPTFQRKITQPVSFPKVPPLEKLAAKIGRLSEEEEFSAIFAYVKTREAQGQMEAPLPDLHRFAEVIATRFNELPPEVHRLPMQE
ncbi:hypothetical protein EPUS_06126 [Endocarpon pusillum Z07020]|uniref:Thioredoxin domain-containing protein n=1 Tax=Endocarpon pusillum (strain Z07020 / HMAS-L-300199) TaxID=1263415 RepID=U1I371_ENDPU|nr:uncharacterized protein EPUS_06126 [Endocarpon pusillum Z07020]ERF76464.1 hypothetical protein EPUS_06126 [Endocarpon pusillum Z07020]